MTTVQRYDRGVLKSAVRIDEGYILAEGFAARPGILEYPQADGSIRRELVPEEELHRTDSLETLARKPVTLEHPEEGDERVFVGPENVDKFGVGDVSEEVAVERLNGFVKIRMAVRRQDAIDAIDQGVGELSAGYTVDLDTTPGTHPVYGRYDAIQKNRKYNHVAIVRMGRAGAGVRMRADSAITPFHPPTPKQEADMAKEVEDAVSQALKRRDADDKMEKLQKQNDALQEKLDKLQGKLDELEKRDTGEEEKKDADGDEDKPDFLKKKDEKDKKTDSARLDWFRERTDALNVARLVGDTGALDGATVAELKRTVVQAQLGAGMRTDASDDYIEAAYDFVKTKAAQTVQREAYQPIVQGLSQPLQAPRADAYESPEDAYLKNLNSAFKR